MLAYLNKKLTMDKNYIKKNGWTFGSPAGHNKLYNSSLFTCLWPPLGGGYSGTEGGHTCIMYFAEEGVFF